MTIQQMIKTHHFQYLVFQCFVCDEISFDKMYRVNKLLQGYLIWSVFPIPHLGCIICLIVCRIDLKEN